MKQKKTLRMLLCLAIVASMLVSNFNALSLTAYAAEGSSATVPDVIEATLMEMSQDYRVNPNARTVLADCIISYSKSSAGIHVEISTGCANGDASVLGVKDIKIQKKVWWGWDTIATSNGGEDTNTGYMGLQFDYGNMIIGETYRISCVHYGNYNGYKELANETSPFIF